MSRRPALFEEFAREFTAEVNRQRSANSATFQQARQELDRIDRQIARLVDAVANGADAKAFNEKIKELEASRPAHEARLAHVPGGQPLLHPNLAKVYRDKVERLTQAIRDPDLGREVFEIIRSFIPEVRLVPRGLNGVAIGMSARTELGQRNTRLRFGTADLPPKTDELVQRRERAICARFSRAQPSKAAELARQCQPACQL